MRNRFQPKRHRDLVEVDLPLKANRLVLFRRIERLIHDRIQAIHELPDTRKQTSILFASNAPPLPSLSTIGVRRRQIEYLRMELLPTVSAALLLELEDIHELKTPEESTRQNPTLEQPIECIALLISNMVLVSKGNYDARIRAVLKTVCVQILVEESKPPPVLLQEDEEEKVDEDKEETDTGNEPGSNEEDVEKEEEEDGQSEKEEDPEPVADDSPKVKPNPTEPVVIDKAEMARTLYFALGTADEDTTEEEVNQTRILPELSRGQIATRKLEAIERAVATDILKASLEKAAANKQNEEEDEEARRRQRGQMVKKVLVRGLQITTVGVVVGAAFAFTGGLAAPGLVAAISALGVGSGSVAFATLTTVHALASMFGVVGGGLAAYKMKKRTQGLSEWRIRKETLTTSIGKQQDAVTIRGMHASVCVSGWLTDKCDFQRPWGIQPDDPEIQDNMELLQRFFAVHGPEKVRFCKALIKANKKNMADLWIGLARRYGRDPDHLLPFDRSHEKQVLTDDTEARINGLLKYQVLEDNHASSMQRIYEANNMLVRMEAMNTEMFANADTSAGLDAVVEELDESPNTVVKDEEDKAVAMFEDDKEEAKAKDMAASDLTTSPETTEKQEDSSSDAFASNEVEESEGSNSTAVAETPDLEKQTDSEPVPSKNDGVAEVEEVAVSDSTSAPEVAATMEAQEDPETIESEVEEKEENKSPSPDSSGVVGDNMTDTQDVVEGDSQPSETASTSPKEELRIKSKDLSDGVSEESGTKKASDERNKSDENQVTSEIVDTATGKEEHEADPKETMNVSEQTKSKPSEETLVAMMEAMNDVVLSRSASMRSTSSRSFADHDANRAFSRSSSSVADASEAEASKQVSQRSVDKDNSHKVGGNEEQLVAMMEAMNDVVLSPSSSMRSENSKDIVQVSSDLTAPSLQAVDSSESGSPVANAVAVASGDDDEKNDTSASRPTTMKLMFGFRRENDTNATANTTRKSWPFNPSSNKAPTDVPDTESSDETNAGKKSTEPPRSKSMISLFKLNRDDDGQTAEGTKGLFGRKTPADEGTEKKSEADARVSAKNIFGFRRDTGTEEATKSTKEDSPQAETDKSYEKKDDEKGRNSTTGRGTLGMMSFGFRRESEPQTDEGNDECQPKTENGESDGRLQDKKVDDGTGETSRPASRLMMFGFQKEKDTKDTSDDVDDAVEEEKKTDDAPVRQGPRLLNFGFRRGTDVSVDSNLNEKANDETDDCVPVGSGEEKSDESSARPANRLLSFGFRRDTDTGTAESSADEKPEAEADNSTPSCTGEEKTDEPPVRSRLLSFGFRRDTDTSVENSPEGKTSSDVVPLGPVEGSELTDSYLESLDANSSASKNRKSLFGFGRDNQAAAATAGSESDGNEDAKRAKVDHDILVWDWQATYGGELYTVTWETTALLKLCKVVEVLALEVTDQITKQVIQNALLAGTVAIPSAMITCLAVVDDPYQLISFRSEKAGIELAHCLMQSEEHRPISMVGYSFGARVVFSCLLELARHQALWEIKQQPEEDEEEKGNRWSLTRRKSKIDPADDIDYRREPASIVEDVVLIGMPRMLDMKEWVTCREIVGGRVVNVYKKDDWIVSYMINVRCWNGISKTCGTHPVESVDGIENFEVSDLVPSHGRYKVALPQILHKVEYGLPRMDTKLETEAVTS